MWVFEGIELGKWTKRKTFANRTPSSHFRRFNLSLMSCSPAELISVSIEQSKFHLNKLYLQTVKKGNHLPIAQPTIDIAEFALDTCSLKVVEPPPLNFVYLSNPLIETHWCGFSGDGFESLFESLPSFLCYYQLVSAFYSYEIHRG